MPSHLSVLTLLALIWFAPVYDWGVRVGPLALHTTSVLCLIAGAAAILTARSYERPTLLRGQNLALLALVLWTPVVALSRPNPNQLRRILALGLFLVAFLNGYLVLGFRERLRRALPLFAISGALGTLSAIALGPGPYGHRLPGAFGNPNSLGMFLEATFPFAVALLLRGPGRRPLLGVVCSGLIVYGLLASGSRGAMIGTMAASAFILSARVSRALLIAGGFAGLLLVSAFVREGRLSRLPTALVDAPQVFQVSKYWLARNGFLEVPFREPPWISPGTLEAFPQTLGARMMIWYQALSAYLASPVVGTGPGGSYFTGLPFDSKVFGNCFNIYLAFFVEFGTLGGLLFLAWQFLLWRDFLRVLLRSGAPKSLVTVGAAVLALFVHALVEDILFGIFGNWIAGLLLGAAAGLGDPARAPPTGRPTGHVPPAPRPPPPGPPPGPQPGGPAA